MITFIVIIGLIGNIISGNMLKFKWCSQSSTAPGASDDE